MNQVSETFVNGPFGFVEKKRSQNLEKIYIRRPMIRQRDISIGLYFFFKRELAFGTFGKKHSAIY